MSDYISRKEIIRSLKEHGVLSEFVEFLIENHPAANVVIDARKKDRND